MQPKAQMSEKHHQQILPLIFHQVLQSVLWCFSTPVHEWHGKFCSTKHPNYFIVILTATKLLLCQYLLHTILMLMVCILIHKEFIIKMLITLYDLFHSKVTHASQAWSISKILPQSVHFFLVSLQESNIWGKCAVFRSRIRNIKI